MRSIPITEHDRLVYDEEIRPYLPAKLFDAHCHVLVNRFHPRIQETLPLATDPLLGDVDVPYLESWWQTLFPDCRTAGMVMPYPTADVDLLGESTYVAETAGVQRYPYALLTHPDTPSVDLARQIDALEPAVLKPYPVFVTNTDPAHASITDIIPESQIQLADARGLAIMLHVSKPRGMADTDNLADIERLVRDYPNTQFILAHCGRCFIAPNMERVLDSLPRAENLWLDTSAVCDLGVFMHLLKQYDRGKILFGSDLVTAAAFRGSYIRLGMSWHVCTADMVTRPGGTASKPTYAAYESAAALCRAMQFCGLTQSEREAIFYGNACRLFEFGFDD